MQGKIPGSPKSWLEKPPNGYGTGPQQVWRRHPSGRRYQAVLPAGLKGDKGEDHSIIAGEMVQEYALRQAGCMSGKKTDHSGTYIAQSRLLEKNHASKRNRGATPWIVCGHGKMEMQERVRGGRDCLPCSGGLCGERLHLKAQLCGALTATGCLRRCL